MTLSRNGVSDGNTPVANTDQSCVSESSDEDEEAPSASCDSDENAGPIPARPPAPLYQLLQRPCKDLAKHTVRSTVMQPGSRASEFDPRRTYKLRKVVPIPTSEHTFI